MGVHDYISDQVSAIFSRFWSEVTCLADIIPREFAQPQFNSEDVLTDNSG